MKAPGSFAHRFESVRAAALTTLAAFCKLVIGDSRAGILGGSYARWSGCPVSFLCVKARHREPEWMDQPELDVALHEEALLGLCRVNRLSATAWQLWRAVRRLAVDAPAGVVRVLDLASGGGDVALGLARRARRAKLSVEIDGCDLSPVAVKHAADQARRAGLENMRFFRRDVLKEALPTGYDVVTCSLFLHHLDERDARELLRRMAQVAGRLVLVDDLCRSRLGYALAWLGCRIFTRSPVVHVDGPRSVAAAFSLDEVAQMAEEAGLAGFRLVPHWPQRFLLSWEKA